MMDNSDLALVARALHDPRAGMASVAARAHVLAALSVATMASLALVVLLVPRLDFSEATSRVAEGADLTPYQLETLALSMQKVGKLGIFTQALLGPTLFAWIAGVACWIAFRVAGASPPFPASFAVMSYAQLPLYVAQALTIPAILTRAKIGPEELEGILPSNLAALIEAGAPLSVLLHSADLFAVWAAVLATLGMAVAARVSCVRSACVIGVLWFAYIALFRLAAPAWLG